MTLRVVHSTAVTPDGAVRRIDLAPLRSGDALPSFVPGSHVMVRCGDDASAPYNAYSLIGPPHAPSLYSCAVLAVGAGSRWLQSRRPGDLVEVDTPRSTFAPVLRARRHLLVAGGIGITPILSLARWLGSTAEVHYVHRPERGAFAEDVATSCDARISTTREDFTSGLADALTRQPLGTHLFVCGPPSLVEATLTAARAVGWPESRLHTEAFIRPDTPRRSFVLELARSGRTLPVSADESVLDVLDTAAVSVDRQCRHGVCGRCRTPVLAGAVDHRDLFLSDDERTRSDSMMVCVSRAAGDRLVVDL